MGMNPEQIEKNELYYYGLVNEEQRSEQVNRYSNTLVPQMYDHNFFYIKEPQLVSEWSTAMKEIAAEQKFLKLFGSIVSEQQQAKWKVPMMEGYDYSEEQLVYMSLVDPEALNKSQTEITYRKAATEQDVQLYRDFAFADAENISLSFAKEKDELIRWLYQSAFVDFYIAVVNDKVVGSVDIYKLQNYYKVENVYVDEAYRKQGIAGTLIKTAVQERADKRLGAGLTTDVGGMALSLYKKLGFAETAFSVNHLFTKPVESVSN
ncbi:GNAT family N-acetyltransferase [Enterococcus sp. BWM-S5]|uniref:GNAT family N-acetyltransferase n=1 Tax=Enterococcus larvae TaxID=2794352 RepID=A0ABS4CMR9_9ENTE|nr:GNAT family N-acetyltransferase [Enterococcus larvae]MBP1047498.1 GNAT family N-acetyltransferase [Enterococcus larvae]